MSRMSRVPTWAPDHMGLGPHGPGTRPARVLLGKRTDEHPAGDKAQISLRAQEVYGFRMGVPPPHSDQFGKAKNSKKYSKTVRNSKIMFN